jgi:cation:H+ antiporter
MIEAFLKLALGLVFLFVSGKYLVESSVVIARRLRIPTMIIGLTVVAFGTSAPELFVSVQAAIRGYPEIAMGNVVGSNISNILLVLAITAIIFPIPVPKSSVRRDWPIMMFVSALLFALCLDGRLSRLEGGILLVLLSAYIIYNVFQARKHRDLARTGNEEETVPLHPGRAIHRMKAITAVLIFVVSCAGLALGAHFLVENAATIASSLGVSQRVISITIVAVGTSIPELVTSVIAALKKETDISVGNILGSNIMNIVAVLGFTGVIRGIPVDPAISGFDIPVMLLVSLLLLILMVPASRSRIVRWEGILMIVAYLAYIYLIF